MNKKSLPYGCPDESRSPQAIETMSHVECCTWMQASTKRSIEMKHMRERWNTPEMRMANRAQYSGGATLCGIKNKKD
jgi:hypothetical protein